MLLIYDKTTGVVLDNSGTSSVWPEGPPDELALVNIPEADRGKVELLRLHDVNDSSLIKQLEVKLYHVDPNTKQVVLDGPRPVPAPISTDPTVDERLTALVDLLVTKGTITSAERSKIREKKARPIPPR